MLLVGLLTVFVLEYTRPDHLIPLIITLKLYALVPLSLFAATLLVETRNPVSAITASSIGKLMIALLVMALIAVPLAIDRGRAWNYWTAMLGYVFLFIMIAKLCDDKEKIKWVFRVLVVIHVWLIFENPALLTDPTRRSYVQNVTFLGDGNDFALSVVIALPMCLYLMQSAKSAFARGFWIVAIVVLFGAIMGTQSRGAALGVIAVLMYLWSRARRKAGGLILILGGALIVGVVASDAYLNRLETIAEYQENGSAMGRITAWKSGFQMANERPLNGMGPGCFPIAFGLFYAPPGYPWLTAHSLYFLTLGELGYPGLFLLLALLWVLYRDNQRIIKSIPTEGTGDERDYRRLMLAISGSLVGFAVSGAFLSVLYYPHLYVLAGLVFATQRLKVLDLGPDEANPIPESRGKERQELRQGRMVQQRRKGVTAGARGAGSGGTDQDADLGQQGQKTGAR